MGLEEHEAARALFRERAAAFLVDNRRGRRMDIRVGGRTITLGPSRANGHCRVRMVLRPDPPDVLRDGIGAGVISCRVMLPETDGRTIEGRIRLIPESGLTVVCDIDDTLKVSGVQDKKALLRNTFLHRYRAVPGVKSLLRSLCEREAGVAFHYVSASPWQLYPALSEFTRREGLPDGVFHLKTLRAKDRSALAILGRPDEFKIGVIEPLLCAWPRRRFAFIGDSTERDPEIYGGLARRYPDRIAMIAIRSVKGSDTSEGRLARAFAGMAEHTMPVVGDGDRWAAAALSAAFTPADRRS